MKPRRLTLSLLSLILSVIPTISYSANLTWKGDGTEESSWENTTVWSSGAWTEGNTAVFPTGITNVPLQTILVGGSHQLTGMIVDYANPTTNYLTRYLIKGTTASSELLIDGNFSARGIATLENIKITAKEIYIRGGGPIDPLTGTGEAKLVIGKGAKIYTSFIGLPNEGANYYGNLVIDGGDLVIDTSYGTGSMNEARLGNWTPGGECNFLMKSGAFTLETGTLKLGSQNNGQMFFTMIQEGGTIRSKTIQIGTTNQDSHVTINFLGGRWEVGSSGINKFETSAIFNVGTVDYYAFADHTVTANTKAILQDDNMMSLGAMDGANTITWNGSFTGKGGITVKDGLTLKLAKASDFSGDVNLNATGVITPSTNNALGTGKVYINGGTLNLATYGLTNSSVILGANGQGGTLNTSGTLTIGSGGIGTLEQQGGTLSLASTSIINLNTGGNLVFTNLDFNLNQSTINLNDGGTLTLSSGKRLTISGTAQINGTNGTYNTKGSHLNINLDATGVFNIKKLDISGNSVATLQAGTATTQTLSIIDGIFNQTGGDAVSELLYVGLNSTTAEYNMTGGTLNIKAGINDGSRYQGHLYIGTEKNDIGRMTLSNNASYSDSRDGFIYIGYLGSGYLTLNDTAQFKNTGNTRIFVGAHPDSYGEIAVNNNSVLETWGLFLGKVSYPFEVVEGGTGKLVMNDNATVTVRDVFFLGDTKGSGILEMNGGTLTVTLNTLVGLSTDPNYHSEFNVHGGTFTGPRLYIGNDGLASSTVTNGTITLSDYYTVGLSGTGTLNLSGGNISSNDMGIGANATGTGTVTISGTGILEARRNLFIGRAGVGSITINGGELKSNAATFIAETTATAQGSLTINGGKVTFGHDFKVAHVNNDLLNTVTITGGVATAAGWSIIGNHGKGEMEMSGGSFSSDGNFVVGGGDSGTGEGKLTLKNGTLNTTGRGNTAQFTIGRLGKGTLIVEGGVINVNELSFNGSYDAGYHHNVVIAEGGNSEGIVEIKNGTLNIKSNGTANGKLYIGLGGKATFSQTGGLVTMQGGGIILGNNTYKAKVDLMGGKWIVAEGTTWSQVNADLTIGNFSYYVTGNNTVDTSVNVLLADHTSMILGSAATLNSAPVEASITWNGSLSGNGGITVKDKALVTLNKTNSYMGDSVVEAGSTLKAGAQGALGNGKIVIKEGATLDGGAQTLTNSELSLASSALLKNVNLSSARTNATFTFVTSESSTTKTTWLDNSIIALKAGDTFTLSNLQQIGLRNGSHLTLGQSGQNNIASVFLTNKSINIGSPASSFILDSGSELTFAGGVTFDLSDVSSFNTSNAVVFKIIELNGGTVSFDNFSLILKPGVDDTGGYYRWLHEYASNEALQADLSSTGTLTLKAIAELHILMKENPDEIYYYADYQYYGAQTEGITITSSFRLDDNVTTNSYNFTLKNNKDTIAHSFTVASLLSNLRTGENTSMDIAGDSTQENWREKFVAITNRDNTFTGDVSISNALLRSIVTEERAGNTNIYTLGRNNTIILNEGSILELTSTVEVAGNYTYANNIKFGSAQTSLVIKEGITTLSGAITMAQNGESSIINESEGTLTLSGNIVQTGTESTLKLQGEEDAGEIILTGKNYALRGMNINGNVSLTGVSPTELSTVTLYEANVQRGSFTLENVELTMGTYGVFQTNGESELILKNSNTSFYDLKLGLTATEDTQSNLTIDSGTTQVRGWLMVGVDNDSLYTHSGGDTTVGAYLVAGTNSSGTIELSGGTITATDFGLGDGVSGEGTFTQSAGTMKVIRDVFIGRNGIGIYNISDGLFSVNDGIPDGRLRIGNDSGSTGELAISGTGEVKTWGLFLSNGSGGNGKITLSDSAKLSVTDVFWIGGDHGKSEMIVDGGTVSISGDMKWGQSSINTETHELTLNDGSFSVGGWNIIGNYGNATLTINGGTYTADGHLVMGGGDGSGKGTLTITDGVLNTIGSRNYPHLTIGRGGIGTMNISGGVVTVNATGSGGNVQLAEESSGTGILNFTGGTLNINSDGTNGNLYIGKAGKASFTQSGGLLNMQGESIILGNALNKATVELLGGKWIVAGHTTWQNINASLTIGNFSYYATGDHTVTSGTASINTGTTLILGSAGTNSINLVWENNLDGKGGLTIQDKAQVTLNGTNSYAGKTTITGGSSLSAGATKAFGTGEIELLSGATLNANGKRLYNNKLTIQADTVIKNLNVYGNYSLYGGLTLTTADSTMLKKVTLSNSDILTGKDDRINLAYNHQLILENTKLELGLDKQSKVVTLSGGDINKVNDGGAGQAMILVDSTSYLTLGGTFTLNLNNVTEIKPEAPKFTFQILGMSDSSDYAAWAENHLFFTNFNVAYPQTGTSTKWKSAYTDKAQIMAELKEFGTITVISLGDQYTYLSKDEFQYTFAADAQYFGADVDNLNFTKGFIIDPSVESAVYRFTLANDKEHIAKSFTISAQLENALDYAGNERLTHLEVTGNLNDPQGRRVLTLTNRDNSFTGNVYIESATLKSKVTEEREGNANIYTLGRDNVVILNAGAILELDSDNPTGIYTYANDIVFNKKDTSVLNKNGETTLTGDITLSSEGNVTIHNESEAGLTLTGNIYTAAAPSTNQNGSLTLINASTTNALVLSGKELNIPQLIIDGDVSFLGNSSELSQLKANGITIKSGDLMIENTTITLGSNGLAWEAGSTLMTLGDNAQIYLNTALTATTDVNWDIIGNNVVLSGSQNITIEGKLSGSGSFTKSGNGLFTLAGDVDYSGTINIAEGSMTVQRSVALDIESLTLGRNVILNIDGSIQTPVMNTERNASIIINLGASLLNAHGTLGENTSLLIQKGGTLSNALFSTEKNAKVVLEGTLNNSTLNMGENTQVTLNGNFNNSHLTLGNNALLQVNGSIKGGSITLNQGAQFTGLSSANNATITFNSESIMKGLILDHQGTVTFHQGSILVAEVDHPNTVNQGLVTTKKNSKSRIELNGLIIRGAALDYTDWNTLETATFALLKADGGFNGSEIGNNVSLESERWGNFLNANLLFEGNTLNVQLTRNATKIEPYAQTEDQKNVARSMDVIVDRIATLKLAGTPLGAIAKEFAYMNLEKDAPAALDMVSGSSSYQLMAAQRTDLLRHVESVRQRATSNMGLLETESENILSFWVEGTQGYTKQDAQDFTPGFKHQSWGGAFGSDIFATKTFFMGIGFAYSNADTTSDLNQDKVSTDAYYIDLYGRWEKGDWMATFVLSGSSASHEIERSITGMGDADGTGRGSSDGSSYIGQVELGYALPSADQYERFIHVISFTLGTTSADSYTESGLGNAGLNITPESMMIAQGAIGFRYFNQIVDSSMQCETARYELRLLLSHDFGDGNYSSQNSFIGATHLPFNLSDAQVDRTALIIGGGFIQSLDDTFALFADVNGEFRVNSTGINASVGIKATF